MMKMQGEEKSQGEEKRLNENCKNNCVKIDDSNQW